MRVTLLFILMATTVACATSGASSPPAAVGPNPESDRLQTIDHYVRVRSTVPSMTGQTTQIYVRERATGRMLARGARGVVLFVHGAGTPAEVAFDVPAADYSWMAYLADAGFDVFSMDTTGYGRSTRPTVMNDPCNLARAQQSAFVPMLIPAPCAATASEGATTLASDWNDIGAVVDYVRALRHVDRISMIAWSLGGPRAGGYAAQHPDRVERLVLLAPAYNRAAPGGAPAQRPDPVVFNTQSRTEFVANWDRQVGCPNQYDAGVRDTVWSEMLQSDPVGATWGTGVRRAPTTAASPGAWNTAVVAKMQTPTLMVAGVHDKQVPPARVRELYADLGSREKVFVDLGCASHNAMWERNRLVLFGASQEWLTQGTVSGMKEGQLRLGYDQD